MYGLNGVLLSERASGIPLHTTLKLLCSGRLDPEAFFDEFVADDRQAELRVWTAVPCEAPQVLRAAAGRVNKKTFC